MDTPKHALMPGSPGLIDSLVPPRLSDRPQPHRAFSTMMGRARTRLRIVEAELGGRGLESPVADWPGAL